ncbi:MAG TPA: alpha/beta hydrolase, partial [Ktedonobacterales bacterium]|nr:alpha/beta hydrolase [Ktedonobacterales bacterium]
MPLFGKRSSQESANSGQASAQSQDGAGAHDLPLSGVTLHYASWGQPTTSERTVILIHGLTASHKEFAKLGPALAAQGWYVLAPDLRGRGLSSKPAQGYGVMFHAADVLAFCDALNLDAVAIVGHSLGAVIGMYLAAVAPQRIRRLVLIDAGGKIPDDTAQAISASVSRLGTVYPSLDAYLGLMSQLPVFQWDDFWEQYFRYDATVRADGTVTSGVPKAAIEEETLALALTRSEALPDLVKCPTLAVRATVGLLGPEAGFILPRDEAERLCSVIAN